MLRVHGRITVTSKLHDQHSQATFKFSAFHPELANVLYGADETKAGTEMLGIPIQHFWEDQDLGAC